MSQLEGHRLGQYEIVELIAKGGMASVYRARQPALGRDVAIKVLSRHFMHEDTFIERFNREVEIIASLQHPHILPVYDFGQYEEMPYIVMAYLGGGTLEDHIKAGNVPLIEIRRLARQISSALDYAHGKNIIHRDFKPANILLDEEGNTYLADFGLSKITQVASNITGTAVLGTPAYMAPEQTSPDELTHAVDIYAFAVTIYQMLTGQLPYDAGTASAILMAHVMQPIPDVRPHRPDLPETIQYVFQQGMAKDPADRYSSAGQLYRDLALALEGKATGEAAQLEPEIITALLMTNMLGRVIFVDNQCLRILKRRQSEARTIIGRTLQEVLGCDDALVNRLMTEIAEVGQVGRMQVQITDTQGENREVLLSAMATRDEDNNFVGADITLELIPEAGETSLKPASSQQKPADSREENFLQTYFKTQIDSLYELMLQWAGKRVARNLEEIINETGQRNVWPVSMKNGHITVQLDRSDTDVYRALLARAITYTAGIIGAKQVARELQHVNKNTDPAVLHFVQGMGLDRLYEELLKD